jgi:hypothetical protein
MVRNGKYERSTALHAALIAGAGKFKQHLSYGIELNLVLLNSDSLSSCYYDTKLTSSNYSLTISSNF